MIGFDKIVNIAHHFQRCIHRRLIGGAGFVHKAADGCCVVSFFGGKGLFRDAFVLVFFLLYFLDKVFVLLQGQRSVQALQFFVPLGAVGIEDGNVVGVAGKVETAHGHGFVSDIHRNALG